MVAIPKSAEDPAPRSGRIWGRAYVIGKEQLYDVMLDDGEIIANVPEKQITRIEVPTVLPPEGVVIISNHEGYTYDGSLIVG